MEARARKSLNLILALFFAALALNVVVASAVLAQPGAKTMKKYEKWVRGTYLKQRNPDIADQEKVVKAGVKGWTESNGGFAFRGLLPGFMDAVAQFDEWMIEGKMTGGLGYFTACNDFRINWKKFFKSADVIPFICPLGIVGNDPNTGKELSKLLCKDFDKKACGLHWDNPHPGAGGSIGIGIIIGVPTGKIPVFGLICKRTYLTATYVEYYYPWTILNASREFYQSSYLDKINVEQIRFMGNLLFSMVGWIKSSLALVKDIAINHDVAGKELRDYGYNIPYSPQDAVPDYKLLPAAMDAMQSLSDIPLEYKDLAPANSAGFGRNLSSPSDRKAMEKFEDAPHFPNKNHRFISEGPNMCDAKSDKKTEGLMQVRLPLEKKVPKKNPSRLGISHLRFLSCGQGLTKRLDQKYDLFLGKKKQGRNRGLPHICMRNNKQTGKTPLDLDKHQKKEAAPLEMCIDKVGNRFSMLRDSFSLHDSDAFWRAITTGAIDLFYALNWKEHFDANAMGRLRMAAREQEFHTFIPEIDRVTMLPNPFANNMTFMGETFGLLSCPEFAGLGEAPSTNTQGGTIIDYNVYYPKSNIRQAGTGNQNTLYVFGYAKGLWGWRGWPIFLPLLRYAPVGGGDPYLNPIGMTRYPGIFVRFS